MKCNDVVIGPPPNDACPDHSLITQAASMIDTDYVGHHQLRELNTVLSWD